ncbi:hypothetical protein RKD18_000764 [Streptomyces phaeoluteigriseus]
MKAVSALFLDHVHAADPRPLAQSSERGVAGLDEDLS